MTDSSSDHYPGMSNQLLFLLHQRQQELDNEQEISNQPLIRTSNTTTKNPLRSLNTSMKKAPPRISKQQPYVSPFVKKANEVAQQRAQLALRKLKTRSSQGIEGVKPDMDFKLTSEYFDPKLRKQEIFKIEPRMKSRKEEEMNNPVALPMKKPTDMTRRTYGVSSDDKFYIL